VDRNRPGFAIRTLPTELIEGYLDQAIRVAGRVRGITPSRVGEVRISVSRVRGITGAPVYKCNTGPPPPMRPSRVVLAATVVGSPSPLLRRRLLGRCEHGGNRSHVGLPGGSRAAHASRPGPPSGQLRGPDHSGFSQRAPVTTAAAARIRAIAAKAQRVQVDYLPRRPSTSAIESNSSTRLDDIAAAARADGLPAPSGSRQRHWSQLTRPSRRITLASLPYPLMTVLPWIRLDRFEERMFVCRITLSKAAKCPFCLF
jgi:hypothetical protein